MFDKAYAIWAILRGKNSASTPSDVIKDQMSERRPLPVGRAEFDEWASRIISGTLLPADEDSMKFALANMLMHLGPTESHREDAFFIHSLRKFAVNQVADTIRKELHEKAKARLAVEEAEKAVQQAAKIAEQEALAASTLARANTPAAPTQESGVVDAKVLPN